MIRFVSPYIIRLKYESRTTLLLFFLLPLVYYVLEYTFTVYTDLLYTGGAVAVSYTHLIFRSQRSRSILLLGSSHVTVQ